MGDVAPDLNGTTETTESNKRPITDSGPNKKFCSDSNISTTDRLKKRKVAVLLSYSGQGYFGMQRNPGCKTIEEDLLAAMLKGELITEEAFAQIQTIQFQRAARTDKGVSAVRQVVSLKLGDGTSPEQVNEHLPDEIKVFSIKRVTKGFNSKTNCDARTYSYMLPTYSFSPGSCDILEEDYRITDAEILKINDILKMFEGTHNFHNFTSKKKPQDPSSYRYIIKFECEKPFLKDGVEFMVLKVKGQSFMLHQIRKMVGLTVAIAKGLAPAETITKAWATDRMDLPVAPGLGLMLEEVHYTRYNEKFGKDGMHDNLSWNEVADDVEKFKQDKIYPTILNTELTEKSMFNWLITLPLHTYDIRHYDSDKRQVGVDSIDEDTYEDETKKELCSSNVGSEAVSSSEK